MPETTYIVLLNKESTVIFAKLLNFNELNIRDQRKNSNINTSYKTYRSLLRVKTLLNVVLLQTVLSIFSIYLFCK